MKKHDNLLFFNMFTFLDVIRERIEPKPVNIALVMKEMAFILRINVQMPEGMVGYDLALNYTEMLLLKDMDYIIDNCVRQANEFFINYVNK